MITWGKTSVSRSLSMGDPVRIINFSKHAKDKWLAGVVTDKHGPLILLWTTDVCSEDILTIYVYRLIV